MRRYGFLHLSTRCNTQRYIATSSDFQVELGVSQAFSERFMIGILSGGVWETGNADGHDAAEDGMVNSSGEASYWLAHLADVKTR